MNKLPYTRRDDAVRECLTIGESKISPPCPVGRTRAEVRGLVDQFQLGNLFLGQVDNFEVCWL